jgi:hypothetical protein
MTRLNRLADLGGRWRGRLPVIDSERAREPASEDHGRFRAYRRQHGSAPADTCEDDPLNVVALARRLAQRLVMTRGSGGWASQVRDNEPHRDEIAPPERSSAWGPRACCPTTGRSDRCIDVHGRWDRPAGALRSEALCTITYRTTLPPGIEPSTANGSDMEAIWIV